MKHDWHHTVLKLACYGGIDLDSLCGVYKSIPRDTFAGVLADLLLKGHVYQDGQRFIGTEAGRGRYIIDDNCKGW